MTIFSLCMHYIFPFILLWSPPHLNGCEEEDILSTASCCTRRSLGAILSIYDMKELPLLPHMKRTAALAQSVRASRTRLYYNLHPVLFVFHAHVQCLLWHRLRLMVGHNKYRRLVHILVILRRIITRYTSQYVSKHWKLCFNHFFRMLSLV